MFGVSRHTIRKAIGDLVHEGWLYREQGAGTFCSPKLKQGKPQTPQLSTSNGKNIGVITTFISDYIFPSIIRGIESYLTTAGYTLTLSCTNNDVDKERQCLQSMLDRNIDGLIIEPTKSSSHTPNINYYLELEKNNIPYLMINQYYKQLVPPHIIVNDKKGGYLATDHLIKLGHEKIIGIFKTDDLQGTYRMQGFIQAFRDNNIPLSPEMIISFSTEDLDTLLLENVRKIFSTSQTTPTGIICYNDQVGLSIFNLLREMGSRVPEDISIVGFDDSYLAEAIKLTSVSHPKMEMGIEAAKWIVAAVENRSGDKYQYSTVYEPELVIRNSTAAVRIKKGDL